MLPQESNAMKLSKQCWAELTHHFDQLAKERTIEAAGEFRELMVDVIQKHTGLPFGEVLDRLIEEELDD
jgi:hypothetical protein